MRSITSVVDVSHITFFRSPRMLLKQCPSSLRKCNAYTVRFLYKQIPCCYYLLPIMSRRLNARTRFRAIAEASIPFSSISLDEMSSSQPVDRELQVRKNLFYFFCIIEYA